MPETVIWWLRRDLRLHDNPVLTEGLQRGGSVIPAFIIDDRLFSSPYLSINRSAFLFEGLRRLDSSLRSRGSYLVIRQGDPVEELKRLLAETHATTILAEPDYSSYATRRDRLVEANLPISWIGSPAIYYPGSVLKPNGEPYTIFTPFAKAWKALPVPQSDPNPLPKMIHTPAGIMSLTLPEHPRLTAGIPFIPDEEEGFRRLQAFIDGMNGGIGAYAKQRNRLDLSGTSELSPYLRFGMLSPRKAASAGIQALSDTEENASRQSAETWLNELIWRDFYIHILYHFPQVSRGNFRSMQVRWENNTEYFSAWCEGRTGYPVVDAAMRALIASGWMHNRARMIVASFLTKDLLVDWRWGEKWFMQHLIDGDPAANNGGWQWCAGTGTDAAPYFRIFNPVTQGQTHDPYGHFVRRWLPALERVPVEYVHAPWTMPVEIQKQAGCRIGYDYPFPVIEHAAARQRALLAYRQ